MGVRRAEVRGHTVTAQELLDLVSRPEAGAVTVFVGVVRDNDPQAADRVVALDYTCHPSAPQLIGQIVAAVLAELDPEDTCEVAAVHRIGRLTVGENAFVVAVSSAHRAKTFEVCEAVVDRVKKELPVWKQQFEADGSYQWSGL